MKFIARSDGTRARELIRAWDKDKSGHMGEPAVCFVPRWTAVLIWTDVATKVATLGLYKGEMSFEFSFGFVLPKTL